MVLRERVGLVFGSLSLDKDEIAFFALEPDFSFPYDINLETAKVDFFRSDGRGWDWIPQR